MNIPEVRFRYYRVIPNSFGLPDKGPPRHWVTLWRWYRGGPNGRWGSVKPFPRGGRTECIISLEDGTEVVGEAICSMSDHFSYRVGREIAFGRAVKAVRQGYAIAFSGPTQLSLFAEVSHD